MQVQDVSFFRLAKQLSAQQADYFAAHPLASAQQETFASWATRSLEEQVAVEQASQAESFEVFLARYFQQYDKV